jgi:hypothetical protein
MEDSIAGSTSNTRPAVATSRFQLPIGVNALKLGALNACKFLARTEEDAKKVHNVLSGVIQKGIYLVEGSGSATDWFMFTTKLFSASRSALCLSLRPGHHVACAQVDEEDMVDVMQHEKLVFLSGRSNRITVVDSIIVDTVTARFVGCKETIHLDNITDGGGPTAFTVSMSGKYDSISGHRPLWKYYGPNRSTLVAASGNRAIIVQQCAVKEQKVEIGNLSVQYLGPPLVNGSNELIHFCQDGKNVTLF